MGGLHRDFFFFFEVQVTDLCSEPSHSPPEQKVSGDGHEFLCPIPRKAVNSEPMAVSHLLNMVVWALLQSGVLYSYLDRQISWPLLWMPTHFCHLSQEDSPCPWKTDN